MARALLMADATIKRQQEQLAAQIATLDVVMPKAEALDRIAIAEGNVTPRQAAKELGVRETDFFDFLDTHGWTYRPDRSKKKPRLAKADKLSAGLLDHDTWEDESRQIVRRSVMVTPKGLAKLAMIVPHARRDFQGCTQY